MGFDMTMYGRLSNAQVDALRPFVAGRRVADLGAGQLNLSLALVAMGAAEVLAIDKREMPAVQSPRLVLLRSQFGDVRLELDVAFLSWPPNYTTPGLLQLLSGAKTIVYLGKNSDGSACGTPALFSFFLRREVVCYVPERPNTMIVYGQRLEELRRPCGEEVGGLTNDGGLPADGEVADTLMSLVGGAKDLPMLGDVWSFDQLGSLS